MSNISTDYHSLIEKSIQELEFNETCAKLYEPIKYALSCGGKRIRPLLTLAVCEAFGENPTNAINQAIGVEMFHNFTLLHDDVMDNADMRRGRPTVHIKYGYRNAILSGDALLTLSSARVEYGCDSCQGDRIRNIFTKTAMEVYEGQQLDMDFENRVDVTVDEYMEMIRLKTSVLLGCACALGAIMAGKDEASTSAIYRFGEKLGLAFQLRDDYLDTFGDPIVFGKEIGGDIVNNKKTWLLITALNEDSSGVIRSELSDPIDEDDKVERVRRVYYSLDLPSRCTSLINKYVDEAISELNNIGLTGSGREYLEGIAKSSRERDV